MSQAEPTLIMDILPWPQGNGFNGASRWWDYVLSKDETKKLNELLGIALLDSDFCQRLLSGNDESILTKFDFSSPMRDWLMNIHATTLQELAEALVSGPLNAAPVRLESAA
jgi:hypothetical protein